MADPIEPEAFIRQFLLGFTESLLLNGFVTADEYHDCIIEIRQREDLETISRRLFQRSPEPFNLDGFGQLRIIELREPDGSCFPFLQGLTRGHLGGGKKLTCFVGHRFLRNIEQSLRFNLIHLFSPYDITLRWSGYDLSARNIFEDVVGGIARADLCVFDNLGTLNKPNVYVEIGIAYTLGKPMLVCEYTGPSSRGRKRIPDTGSVPSDLEGLFRIQYGSYKDLCQQIYFGLPVFLERNNLD